MPAGGYLLIGFLLGGLLGLLVGWLYGRGRAPVPDDRLANELRQQLAERNGELTKVQEQLRTEASSRSAAEASRLASEERCKELAADAGKANEQLAALREEFEALQNRHAAATAQLDTERKTAMRDAEELQRLQQELDGAAARLLGFQKRESELAAKAGFLEERLASERAQLEKLEQRFAEGFEAVANKLLVENSSRFGQQSAESLDKLLAPLKENLQDFKARLETVHKDTLANSTLLKDQVGRIGTEAANLSKALKGDVKVLGNWGENMLDLILEKSGLQLGVHYRRQSSGRDDEGDRRFLDVVIDLPEKRHLVVDSKVSLKFYEEHVNCEDAHLRRKRLDEHVECIRNHFRGLGAKRYQDTHGISAPDFVLMYIPIEAAFFGAVGTEPNLFSDALDRNVVLTSNSTLLATLRTVSHVWRLADQQKYALEIADRGGKLYDKFVGFISDLQEIRQSLDNSQRLVGEAFKKLQSGPGNLIGQADKLKTLGVKASKSLPPDLVERAASPPLLEDHPQEETNLGK